MELYLLKVGQNNEIEDLMNQEMVAKTQKYDAYLYMLDDKEAIEYLVAFAFESKENRDKFAEEIPHIAFVYETIENYPEDVWNQCKEGKFTPFYQQHNEDSKEDSEKSRKKRKKNFCENKIDCFFERMGIEYNKKENNFIEYEFKVNNKEGYIIIDYKDKYVMGGITEGYVYMTHQKRFIKQCLYDLLNSIEAEKKKEIAS